MIIIDKKEINKRIHEEIFGRTGSGIKTEIARLKPSKVPGITP
jgi:hypothetical protein